MISRRNFLSAAPIGVIAAPSIVQALPAPMPIVDAGTYPNAGQLFLKADSSRTISRIWYHADEMRKNIKGNILASDMKMLMEDVVKMVTGHKPPFILRSFAKKRNEFIFHTVSNKTQYIFGKAANQPCYRIEWCPEFYSEVFHPDWKGNPNTGYVEYMTSVSSIEESRVIYDL